LWTSWQPVKSRLASLIEGPQPPRVAVEERAGHSPTAPVSDFLDRTADRVRVVRRHISVEGFDPALPDGLTISIHIPFFGDATVSEGFSTCDSDSASIGLCAM
jgi:hypothetical protein